MKIDTACNFTFTGLCSGAGGLDLGFELAGFRHQQSMDINPWAIQTLTHNRPDWLVSQADLHDFSLTAGNVPDVLLAGVPCQGFSLGGNRQDADPRNQLLESMPSLLKGTSPTNRA